MKKIPWLLVALGVVVYLVLRSRGGPSAPPPPDQPLPAEPGPKPVYLVNTQSGQVIDAASKDAPAFVDTNVWKPLLPTPAVPTASATIA